MRHIRIIAVGRLKAAHWRAAADYYLNRLKRSFAITEVIVKDADPDLRIAERKKIETLAIARLLRPSELLICLDESGEVMDSRRFSSRLDKIFDSGSIPCFVVGGAYGLSLEDLPGASLLSFGRMTFTHELARVVLFEQIYRAGQIMSGSGYHH